MNDSKETPEGTEAKPSPTHSHDRESLPSSLPRENELATTQSSLPALHEENQSYPENGEVRDLSISIFPTDYRRGKSSVLYERHLAECIVELVSKGWAGSAIAALPGMPSILQVKKWENNYEDFREAMKLAREARAETLVDAALHVASKSQFKTFQADRVKTDVALKVAAALDPDTYGNKTKVSSEHKSEVTFVIKTNVPGEHKVIEIDKRDPSVFFAEQEAKKNEKNKEQ